MECIFCLNENAYFDGVNYVCPDCGREWPCDEIADDDDDNNKLRCPECGSHLVYPDSSGINDYACDACGCRWDGDDDDYDEGRQNGYVHGMNVRGESNDKEDFNRIVEASQIVFNRKMYLYPMPDSEMRKTKNLVQNPGW